MENSEGLHFEIERKFLIERPAEKFLKSGETCEITQIYLDAPEDGSLRIRRSVCNGNSTYTKTEKHPVDGITRTEDETEISEEDFYELWKDEDIRRRPLHKTRTRIPYSGHTLEIDIYPAPVNATVLEVELGSAEEKINLPDEITVIREVTGESEWLNSTMALRKPRELLNEAIHLATDAHADQTRKGSGLPYIYHPIEASMIAADILRDLIGRTVFTDEKNAAAAESIMAAAALHDTVEDTDVTENELLEKFGFNVAHMVAGESENKYREASSESTWLKRKQETILHLKTTDEPRLLIIALSDKLSNLRAMVNDFRSFGDGIWERFNQKDPRMHGWYYGSVLNACMPLSDTHAFKEYAKLLEEDIFHMAT